MRLQGRATARLFAFGGQGIKRVVIVGGAGSGKSTLARMLGERSGLPVFHMDQIHWQENWVERPQAEKIPMAKAVEDLEAWIFEGGLSVTYGNRMARADTIIWLDLPVGLRLWRVTKRLFRYLGTARPDLPKGCVERLHPATLEFYWFIWTSRNSSRDKIAKLVTDAPNRQKLVHLCSRLDVNDWVNALPKE